MEKKTNKTSLLLTIDLESWIFSKRINDRKLNVSELRKLDNDYAIHTLEHVLNLLRKHNQKITFFVVAKLEELYPGLIEKILRAGHEVGWHGYSHATITNVKILQQELENSKEILRRYAIRGFQAPSIVFFREGYALLEEYGFLYSSSIYGNANIVYNFNGIYEIPVSVSNKNYKPRGEDIVFPSNLSLANLLKFGVPFGSSLFWGILGVEYYFKRLQRAKRSNATVNLFMHEWQLVTPDTNDYKKDIGIAANPFSNLLFLPYRINVMKMFEYLISKFSFQRCIDYLGEKGYKT